MPTHLIEISEHTMQLMLHVLLKISITARYVAKKSRKRKGRGKECKVPMHLIEISELTHAVGVTKNRHNCKVCSQEK